MSDKQKLAVKAVDYIMSELKYDQPTELTLGDDPLTEERNSAIYTDGVVYDYLHQFHYEVNDELEKRFGFYLENYGQGIYTIAK